MEAVHCKTPEQAQKLLSYWYSLGRAWHNGSKDTTYNYDAYKENTVYYWDATEGRITYSDIRYAQQAYPNALQSFEEYFKNKTMNKQQIVQEIKATEDRLKKLREQLETPDIPEYNGGKFYGLGINNERHVILHTDYGGDKVRAATLEVSSDGYTLTGGFRSTLTFNQFCEKALSKGHSIHTFNTRKELLYWLLEE